MCVHRNVFGHFSFLISLSPARDPQLAGASAASHFLGDAGVLSCSTIAGPSMLAGLVILELNNFYS